ncbi:DUF3800 domain-containing protein [Escherichia coli]|uniref:DUF3800 domain-containing protein n=9 Tax=Escherichia coli TaxID=562 RepID=A0AAN5UEE6_ECOLX|nr:DUF3800 domain-containing protein [Escherichia coli]APK31673.1 hypothetical protein RG40_20950 [Escherichia coli]EES9823131.1 DUF3800 domain-containing protein [Escherichia coli]EFA5092741.1 DUF3800 domain-containing protein [Escherichia coli]EFB2587323.1 DUF3800 domain-containing protein [Escherichia coli]EFB3932849.1 DUF3800 domain-containing protein [Escherichia coli]
MSKNSKFKRDAKKNTERKKQNRKNDKIIRRKMLVPNIYFDESGNTGSNLLDPNQPVFSLASCSFSDNDARNLIGLLNSRSPLEAHFKNLKRRKNGQDAIIRFMSSKLINTNNIKISIFLKDFMITTKIVDILIEHMMYLTGEDLYLNGRNIALSNMLYYCLPTFCDKDLVAEMYSSFVNMIRGQEQEQIDKFYSDVENVRESSSHEQFKRDVDLIFQTRNVIHDALNGVDKLSLDPSIPALFAHCVQWGNDYPKGFHIIHDDSHSIEKQKLLFAQFMDWSQSDVELGYDRRKFNLPLEGKSLIFANSEEHLQLQVSDIIASSFSYWAAGVSRGETEDYLFLELNKLNLDRFIGNNKIWPTMDITPEELGTVHTGGLNAANNIPFFLQNAVPNPDVINAS